jgi:hypothetical protein
MANNKSDKNQSTGFAGLDNFVSEVDKIPETPVIKPEKETASSTTGSSRKATPKPDNRRTPESPSKNRGKTPTMYVDKDGDVFVYEEQPQQASTAKYSGYNNKLHSKPKYGLILLAFLGGILIVGLLSSGGGKQKIEAPPVPPVTEQYQSNNYVAPTPVEKSAPTKKQRKPLDFFDNSLTEEKPSVGRGQLLNNNQIAYCISEKIRINAMKPLVDNYNSSDVNIFNMAVDDYNSRCGSYKYKSGSLEYVKRKVNENVSMLESEGRDRILNNR